MTPAKCSSWILTNGSGMTMRIVLIAGSIAMKKLPCIPSIDEVVTSAPTIKKSYLPKTNDGSILADSCFSLSAPDSDMIFPHSV